MRSIVPPARMAHRSFASAVRLTGAAGSSAGMKRSRRWRNCKLNMPRGWTHCRTISETAPRPRRYKQLSISISPSFKRSNHHAVSAVIDQADGPTSMGYDDA